MMAGAVLALAGAGCGSASTLAPTPTKPAANMPSERPIVVNEMQLPADFPTDFPRYANAKLFSAISDEKHAIMSLTSEDGYVTILNWYREAFIAAGYRADQNVTGGTITSQSYLKDNIKFVVNADDQTGKHPATLFSVTRTDLSKVNP